MFSWRFPIRLVRLPLQTSSVIHGEDGAARRVVDRERELTVGEYGRLHRPVVLLLHFLQKYARSSRFPTRNRKLGLAWIDQLLRHSNSYLITGVISEKARSVRANVRLVAVAEDKMAAGLPRAGSLVLASRSLESPSTRHLAFASAKRCVS